MAAAAAALDFLRKHIDAMTPKVFRSIDKDLALLRQLWNAPSAFSFFFFIIDEKKEAPPVVG